MRHFSGWMRPPPFAIWVASICALFGAVFARAQGDGVKVIVAVQTRAIVREIEIAGAERIKPKRLRKEIKLKLNQPVDEKQLEEARQKIIEVYQGKGYTDVSVQFRVDPIDE